eukprot:TRINITY_DN469_c0_g1_i9.p1 TRINITY_DN469_c0_g1~~TRINITY_DN469_c0_g1_i9.p1  ORF type:complete len:598 (+),score=64.15 TRINITY_DN469_c0_g1_i9:192-1985(+)
MAAFEILHFPSFIALFLFPAVSLFSVSLCAGDSTYSLPKVLSVTHKYSHMEGSASGFADVEIPSGVQPMSRSHYALLQDHDVARVKYLESQRSLVAAPNGTGEGSFLGGNTDSFSTQGGGLYYATIYLGTPEVAYPVDIDTGSGLFWVNCDPCLNCNENSSVVDLPSPYNISASTTSGVFLCNSSICASNTDFDAEPCVPGSDLCFYKATYGDTSASFGFLMADRLRFSSLEDGGKATPVDVVLGCGFNQSGNFLSSTSVSGLMGLNRGPFSVVTQLNDTGSVPPAFAHCLGGEQAGNGLLVFGEVNTSSMEVVYSPMLYYRSYPLYFIQLNKVALGGVDLPGISASTFGSGTSEGTIFDSGTTVALVPDALYTAMETKLKASVKLDISSSVSTYLSSVCWDVTSLQSFEALDVYFPNVTLKFDGAQMHLTSLNYLLLVAFATSDNNYTIAACFQWKPKNGAKVPTILGDIVLRDKLVIYDIANDPLGWTSKEISCSEVSVVVFGSTVSVVSPGPRGSPASSSALSPPPPTSATTPSFSPPRITPSSSPFPHSCPFSLTSVPAPFLLCLTLHPHHRQPPPRKFHHPLHHRLLLLEFS